VLEAEVLVVPAEHAILRQAVQPQETRARPDSPLLGAAQKEPSQPLSVGITGYRQAMNVQGVLGCIGPEERVRGLQGDRADGNLIGQQDEEVSTLLGFLQDPAAPAAGGSEGVRIPRHQSLRGEPFRRFLQDDRRRFDVLRSRTVNAQAASESHTPMLLILRTCESPGKRGPFIEGPAIAVKTLYLATRVRTLGHPTEGEWILLDDRHIERVGSGEPPRADRLVELPGTTIIPGFIDTHVHLTGTGLSGIGIPLEQARSGEELLGLVAEELTHSPSKILAHGFDESRWKRPDIPGLAELDDLGDVPLILVRADGHVSLANTAALLQSGALEDDGVEHDREGRPTGLVRRDANATLQRWFHQSLSDHEVRELQLQAAALAAARGITCVHEMAIPASRGRRDVEVLMEHRHQLPVDVVPYVADKDIPYVMDLGLETIGGDLSLDGSIGARTAGLSEPYVDGPGAGALYENEDELAEFFHNAHLAGLQVAVHAIGDAAIEQAVTVWERVYGTLDSRQRRHFRARRHRIEHFEMPQSDQIERAAALGLAISVQPAFDAEWGQPGALYEQRLGTYRAAPMNPFGTLISRGLEVGAGSDSPITSLDPMYGLWGLESHHDPGQRMGREDSIRLFTIGSARLAHLENKKGSLAPGKQADFAAYEADPFTAPDLRELRPVLTVSRGREVYAR
jgi:predicted amidohydrolase YtcJ